jgi:hypothetical protein
VGPTAGSDPRAAALTWAGGLDPTPSGCCQRRRSRTSLTDHGLSLNGVSWELVALTLAYRSDPWRQLTNSDPPELSHTGAGHCWLGIGPRGRFGTFRGQHRWCVEYVPVAGEDVRGVHRDALGTRVTVLAAVGGGVGADVCGDHADRGAGIRDYLEAQAIRSGRGTITLRTATGSRSSVAGRPALTGFGSPRRNVGVGRPAVQVAGGRLSVRALPAALIERRVSRRPPRPSPGDHARTSLRLAALDRMPPPPRTCRP